MPTLYHFVSNGYKEDLVLDRVRQHMVPGRLCQYLRSWQLDGIRFLYRHVMGSNESCILNDECGLGKSVTVAVFLGAILTNEPRKKCLIVVRDEEYLDAWRFHLSILTSLRVKVIEKTSDIDYETVFLIKWSILKDIDQTNFDYIIVDNRGDMLTNKFCTGILLRYYEYKVSIIISSTDVTADIKLLHILLRLCGRENSDYKHFEEKFQMPTLKDGVIVKADLEEYFLKREKVINFCREFRLRRYRHQFEEEFPLVSPDQLRRNVEDWRNHESSLSSGSVKLLSSSSEKDTEELFKTYFQVKDEANKQRLGNEVQQIIERISAEVDDDNESDEVIVMSPLLFVDSESDSDQEPESKEKNKTDNTESNKPPLRKVVGVGISSTASQSKLERPLKKLAQTRGAMLLDKCLRSQRDSPLHAGKKTRKSVVQITPTDEGAKSPSEKSRKPMVKVKKDGDTENRLRDVCTFQVGKQCKTTEKQASNVREGLTEVQRAVPVDQIQPKSEDQKVLHTTSTESHKTKANEDEPIRKKTTEEPPNQKDKEDSSTEKSSKTSDRRKQKNPRKNDNSNRLKRATKDHGLEEKTTTQVKRNRGRPAKGDQKSGAKENSANKRGCIELKATLIDAKKFLNKKYNLLQKGTREHRALRRSRTADELKSDKFPPLNINSATGIKDERKPLKKNTSLTKTSSAKENTSSNTVTKSTEVQRALKQTKTIYSDDEEYVPPRSVHPNGSSDKLTQSNLRNSRTLRSHRSKPLTVLSPIGLHSRSTRAMERNTRSCQVQNKYMKVAFAQVRLNKKLRGRPKLSSTPHRKSVVFVKGKPTRSPPPPLPSSPPVIEGSLALESMQLGQVLSPSNCPPVSDFIAPAPKNMQYDFPLMLDKVVPETDCITVSENNNEVIVLTGSSTNDSEARPLVTPYIRPSMRPPMVTIPRPVYDKAQSPDLFSLCGEQSLPCSQQKTNFEGFKIFGSELRQSFKSSSQPDTQYPLAANGKRTTPMPRDTSTTPPQPQCIDNEDAMFEITSNGTFGNMLRINSNGDLSPVRGKNQSIPAHTTPHLKNRITNYLVGNGNTNGTTSPEDPIDHPPKTPKRRKSLSGTTKRSPRSLSGGKSQSTKLTQWLVKNSVVRISDSLMKPQSTKRRRLDLSFKDD